MQTQAGRIVIEIGYLLQVGAEDRIARLAAEIVDRAIRNRVEDLSNRYKSICSDLDIVITVF